MGFSVQFDCVLDKSKTPHNQKRDFKLIRIKKMFESSIEDYGITTIQ